MNILIIYDVYHRFTLRQTISDYLYSFGKHAHHDVYYCNYAYGLPGYFDNISFDLIIFHQSFSNQFRQCDLSYEEYTKRLQKIKASKGIKVLFCQDEYFKMTSIAKFVKEFQIEAVFSVAEESEWKTIYHEMDRSQVQIQKVLTGYVDHNISHTIDRLKLEKLPRDIDIGYRAAHNPPWLGRHGKLKMDVADVMKKASDEKGLLTDIKMVRDDNDYKDLFHGLDWYRFLLRCKACIGVEGGSSVFDDKGEIYQRSKAYVKQHPKSSFEEIEANCFPGLDGNLSLFAISPRHFEACATKTCQILVEGKYSGILKPGVHYLELKKDFSNVDEVLELVKREEVREEITDRAYRDIIQSGHYDYGSFVSDVLDRCFSLRQQQENENIPSSKRSIYYKVNGVREWLLWKSMFLEIYSFKKIKKLVPMKWVNRLKLLRNRGQGGR